MDTQMPSSEPAEVVIGEAEVRRWFMRVMALLLVAFVITSSSKLYFDRDSVYGLVYRFDVFFAGTVPTWFAAGCLLVGAGIAGVVAGAKRSRSLHHGWATFAVLLLILSAERATGTLSELIAAIGFSGTAFDAGSLLTNIPFVLLFTIVCLGLFLLSPRRRSFWTDLPATVQKRLFVAIGLYFVSTVVIALLLWWRVELVGWRNAGAYALVAAQWVLEMMAYVLMLGALVAYVARDLGEIRVRFTNGK